MGNPVYSALAASLLGWVGAARGDAGGIEALLGIRSGFLGQGVEITDPLLVTMATDGCLRCGQVDTGLALLDEAQPRLAARAQVAYDAELLRLEGELLLAESDGAEPQARRLFSRSLVVAQHQGARSYELRTALSLARLNLVKGDAEAACGVLEPIYQTFSEGIHTPDLQAAADLLSRIGDQK
jgi:predicted ATPase